MSLNLTHGMFVTDEWREAASTFGVTSPSTGEVAFEVADCGPAEARRAADVAWQAFESWKERTPFERSEILYRWQELLLENQEELARTISTEMGKPIREARGEVAYSAGFIRWYAEEAKRTYGQVIPSHTPGKRLLALSQPVGPVYAVTPWNFPTAMLARKVGPALAAGCTLVVKPAEQSPVSALHMAQLWLQAGGPAGTLQVLPAQDPVPVSAVLMEDPRIRKVTFTGSTEVGRILYRQSAQTVKKISLELGGHAPYIVFADADIGKAVREVIACKFRNTGQTCVSANRIYVHESIAQEFSERYVEATRELQLGDPLLDSTDVGPLVDGQGLAKVEEHVQDAVGKGAKVALGGRRREGLYFEPTVLTGVTGEMRLMSEETFGPVAPILTFRDTREAVRLANDTPFGLAAYLYTNDLSRAWQVAEQLDYGIVGVNDGVPSVAHAPFGGVKQSGLGREGGPWGIEEYLEVKYVSMGLPGEG